MQTQQLGRLVYAPAPEEIPMTFQVGMIGSDGVLLASDTLCTAGPQYSGAIRSTYNTPKIELLEEKDLALCWAGDQFGRLTTEIISDTIGEVKSHANFKQFLVSCARQSLSRVSAMEINGNDVGSFRNCMALIVIRQKHRPIAMWRIEVLNHGGTRKIVQEKNPESAQFPPMPNVALPEPIYVEPVTTKHFTGDISNPAVYFAEKHFYEHRRVPVQELSLLAAHTVLMAGKLSSGVGGLQIALCRDSGFTILSDEEIAALRERSEKMDADLAVSLGVPLL